ncbi:hypothetical protein [Glycomyces sp. YM15]|uniref:hypothetical protein n=1 Tax=Glycomyces sp. YM15 TaxID=2800446 RepID=UPI0019662EC2|nr:hypothetical protein [Glycomyces sp. YM15]
MRKLLPFADTVTVLDPRSRVRECPTTSTPGSTPWPRPKALTHDQGKALPAAGKGRPIHAYALSMFTGVRTEEARPLEWAHTHLNPVEGQTCSCGSE